MEMKVRRRTAEGKGGPKRRWLDRMRGHIREKGLSGEELYDRATWRRTQGYVS